jgi:tRNA(Ile)-lysidine synthase
VDEKLLKKILVFIERYELLERGDRVLLAVSGGSDSVFLLYSFLELKGIYSLDIAVAHFNHGIRGDEADRDEEFTGKLAKKFGLKFYSKKENVIEFAKEKGMSLEEAGRVKRYHFLEEKLREWGGNKIATGHTLTDTVETLLFNLVRGAGPKGISGIPPKRGNIIRPLLPLRREEIKNYLDKEGIPYRVDLTNLDTKIVRNFIRIKILPLLRRISPGFEERVLRTSELLRETVEYMERVADGEILNLKKPALPGEIILEREGLLKLPPIVRRWVYYRLFNLNFEHTEAIEKLIKRRGTHHLPDGWKVDVSYGDIRFYRDESTLREREIEIGINTIGEINMVLEVKRTKRVEKDTPFTVYFPADSVNFPLLLRGKKDGDKIFVKPGMTKKLKKIFIEKKIPRWKRNLIPILEDKGGILWVVGVVKSFRKPLKGEEWIKMEARKYERGKFWIYDN